MSAKPLSGGVLPQGAYLSINRCNLPASILGELTFQQQPTPVMIDGVAELHKDLFQRLACLPDRVLRVDQFCDYLDVHFRVEDQGSGGYRRGGGGRPNTSWQRVIRGWFFGTDSGEGAILKAWVESRFGLLPRFHRGPIRDCSGASYLGYLEARAQGLYNTNALEAQLDLVYSYCQYELSHPLHEGQPPQQHLSLYRGINRLEPLELITSAQEEPGTAGLPILLLNNLNSFALDPERASECGDRVVKIQVPIQKVFCFEHLFPRMLKGEGEYLVIGGLYRVEEQLL